MLSLLLPALLCLLPQDTPAPAPAKPAEAKPLGFSSFKLPFTWNAMIPIKGAEVDGLRLDNIAFSKRETTVWPLKGADFGTHATLNVTNTSDKPRIPGFAVAVFDGEDRLLGVAYGGTKFGTVKPGATESFDLSFHQVLERLPKGEHFFISIELID